jgi:hypothetical protein
MLMSVVRGEDSFETLPPVMKTSLFMIMHKVGRILSGDSTFEDHWTDIEGYSRLVRERLPNNTFERRKRQLEDVARLKQVNEAIAQDNQAAEEGQGNHFLTLKASVDDRCKLTDLARKAMTEAQIRPAVPGVRHTVVGCCGAKKDA